MKPIGSEKGGGVGGTEQEQTLLKDQTARQYKYRDQERES